MKTVAQVKQRIANRHRYWVRWQKQVVKVEQFELHEVKPSNEERFTTMNRFFILQQLCKFHSLRKTERFTSKSLEETSLEELSKQSAMKFYFLINSIKAQALSSYAISKSKENCKTKQEIKVFHSVVLQEFFHLHNGISNASRWIK